MDKYVYLCNTLNLEKFKTNNVNKFTNILKPPLIFEENTVWEVALRSCLLPFKGYQEKPHTNDILEIALIIEKRERNIVNKYQYRISISYKTLINKKPDRILRIIIDQLEKIANLKVFSQLLSLQVDNLIISRIISSKLKTNGIFANIYSISILFDNKTQDIFGLDSQMYHLYSFNNEITRDEINTIVGSKTINFEIKPSPYIIIYTDIIQPISLASNNTSILDVLPFGDSRTAERKYSDLKYIPVNKNIIEDISIYIQNSGFKMLENHAETCILCLHFREKIYNGNK